MTTDDYLFILFVGYVCFAFWVGFALGVEHGSAARPAPEPEP